MGFFSMRHEKDGYRSALASPRVNSSDFILLAVALIKQYLGSKGHSDLEPIKKLFLENENAQAVDAIKQLLATHKDIPRMIKQIIASKSDEVFKHDDPEKNASRRYFETRFTIELWNSFSESEYKSIEKLSAMMREMYPKIDADKEPTKPFDVPSKVDSSQAAEKVIGDMRQFAEVTKSIGSREKALKKMTPIAETRDRKQRSIEQDKDPIYSMNPGIMKSLSPNPADERVSDLPQNRIPDTFVIDKQKGEKGFSASRPHVPFTNSISGTTYSLISVLENYIAKYKSDPDLQKDIDNIVKAFVSFTCKNGYHSLAEMMTVLSLPEVKKVFTDNNLFLRTEFPPTVIDKSFDSGGNYARKICLQHALHDELRSMPGKKE